MVMIEAAANDSCIDGPIERLFDLKYNISALKRKKSNQENWINELNEIDEEIQKIINENSEIKKRYLELIQNPKYKFLNDIYKAKKDLINTYLERIDKNAGVALQLKAK